MKLQYQQTRIFHSATLKKLRVEAVVDDMQSPWLNFTKGLEQKDRGPCSCCGFLENGLLPTYTLPPNEITKEGLQRMMRRVVACAQAHEDGIVALKPQDVDHCKIGEFGHPMDDYLDYVGV